MIFNSVSVILLISQLVLAQCLSLVSSVHDLKGQLKINNDFISANGNGKPIDSSASGSGSGSSSGYSTSNSSDIRYLFSPSRSYLKLIEYPSTEPSNTHPQVKYYHFDKDGLFEIPNLQSGKQYELVIESVDFKFKRSNHFKIVVDAGEAAGGLADGSAGSESDSPLTVYELLKGYDNGKDGGKRLLKLRADPLVISQDAVVLRSYSHAQRSQLDGLPIVGYLKSHPYLAGIMLACAVLGLLPRIITMVDPSFAERVLEATAPEAGAAPAAPAVVPAAIAPAAVAPAGSASSSSGRYKGGSSKRRR
ncbi:unnamed protein product [[Candida] boidinii]|nr:unnamed protein product [[Candida] boidinii]